jgi:hypothetical protein
MSLLVRIYGNPQQAAQSWESLLLQSALCG